MFVGVVSSQTVEVRCRRSVSKGEEFTDVDQSRNARVHCRGSRVNVPKFKVGGWRFSDVNRDQEVKVHCRGSGMIVH